ncbi:MAG: DUF6125 family protein [Candidatus Helarchaeota archaeon]
MHSLRRDDKLLKFIMENELNIFTIWFTEVEKRFDLETAIQMCLNVWNKIAKIDSKKISNLFQIEGKNLDEILELLDIAAHLMLTKIEFQRIDENSAYMIFTSCYWQKILDKYSAKKNQFIRCNEICINAFSTFVDSINPKFKVIADKSILNGDGFCRIKIIKE